ncbi:MAG: hypothetical protein EPN88_09100 [Bacteroidetes bacterium]|nr:MAG: hypothetical protein EPN88_09100 [Bacteroidota bacterium]
MEFENFDPVNLEIDFGKYEGKTILEVFKINPNYINWILINTDLLGPSIVGMEICDFPFKEMREHGYFPPQVVMDAYNKRKEGLASDLGSLKYEEQEQASQDLLDEQGDAFWEDMWNEGYRDPD